MSDQDLQCCRAVANQSRYFLARTYYSVIASAANEEPGEAVPGGSGMCGDPPP